MRNILVVTGGAGFIGSNLISELLKFKKFRILSIDNYSSGLSKNHIKNKRIKYLKGNTKNIDILLKSYIGKIHSIFHFGEFMAITIQSSFFIRIIIIWDYHRYKWQGLVQNFTLS